MPLHLAGAAVLAADVVSEGPTDYRTERDMTVTGIIEVPDAAVQAVAESLMFEYESGHALPEGATWRSWEGRARELLAKRPRQLKAS